MGRARPLEPGPQPRAALGPVLGWVRAWSQARRQEPWTHRLQGPCPAYVSAMLTIIILR